MKSYNDWVDSIPGNFKNDPLWTLKAYRYALFLGDLCWFDNTKLSKDKRTIALADQLYRAVGSIAANISEGYSRKSGRDQARFYEYALGSARESRGWYHHGRHVLGEQVVSHRMELITFVIRLLMGIIPAQRGSKIKENTQDYQVNEDTFLSNIPLP